MLLGKLNDLTNVEHVQSTRRDKNTKRNSTNNNLMRFRSDIDILDILQVNDKYLDESCPNCNAISFIDQRATRNHYSSIFLQMNVEIGVTTGELHFGAQAKF